MAYREVAMWEILEVLRRVVVHMLQNIEHEDEVEPVSGVKFGVQEALVRIPAQVEG